MNKVLMKMIDYSGLTLKKKEENINFMMPLHNKV